MYKLSQAVVPLLSLLISSSAPACFSGCVEKAVATVGCAMFAPRLSFLSYTNFRLELTSIASNKPLGRSRPPFSSAPKLRLARHVRTPITHYSVSEADSRIYNLVDEGTQADIDAAADAFALRDALVPANEFDGMLTDNAAVISRVTPHGSSLTEPNCVARRSLCATNARRCNSYCRMCHMSGGGAASIAPRENVLASWA